MHQCCLAPDLQLGVIHWVIVNFAAGPAISLRLKLQVVAATIVGNSMLYHVCLAGCCLPCSAANTCLMPPHSLLWHHAHNPAAAAHLQAL